MAAKVTVLSVSCLLHSIGPLMSQPKNELTATKFSHGLRFVSLMTKFQHISDPINISIQHSGDILAPANFNALIKSCFFNCCFTLWSLIFRHVFGIHKHLINLLLKVSIFFTFVSYSFSFITP